MFIAFFDGKRQVDDLGADPVLIPATLGFCGLWASAAALFARAVGD